MKRSAGVQADVEPSGFAAAAAHQAGGRLTSNGVGSSNSADPLAGVLARMALDEQAHGGQLRRAPIKGPSGPRRQGEGVEEEDQAVVGIEKLPNGGVQLRVTLLAAGFVIGASGASVREISATTGAVVQSWSEGPVNGCHRPSRVFRVQGQRRAVASAVEIIYEAVERYKELCEGKRRGEFVQRQQRIRGVEFSYQPPPRAVAPHAAALGTPPGQGEGSEDGAMGDPDAADGRAKRGSGRAAVQQQQQRRISASGMAMPVNGNGVYGNSQQQQQAMFSAMAQSSAAVAGHHAPPNAWANRSMAVSSSAIPPPPPGPPPPSAHIGAAAHQSAVFAAAADQYAYHTHMAAAAAAAANAAYAQQQGAYAGNGGRSVVSDSLFGGAHGSQQQAQQMAPPGYYTQQQQQNGGLYVAQHRDAVAGGLYAEQGMSGNYYDDMALRSGTDASQFGASHQRMLGAPGQVSQQLPLPPPGAHYYGSSAATGGSSGPVPPPRLSSPGLPVNEAARLLGSALTGSVLGMSSPPRSPYANGNMSKSHSAAALLRANGNGSAGSLHHSGGSQEEGSSGGDDVPSAYSDGSLHSMSKTASLASINTPPLTPVPPRRIPSTENLGGGLHYGSAAGSFSPSRYDPPAYSLGLGNGVRGSHSTWAAPASGNTAALPQPGSPPAWQAQQAQQQPQPAWLRVASSAPAPPGGRAGNSNLY